MPEIYLLSGIQAAGKSTVADLLARRFRQAIHVGGDAIREMVVSGRSEMSPAAPPESVRQLMLRYRASIAVARVYLEGGFDVILEDVVIGPMLTAYLAELPFRQIHLVMLCPAATAVAHREKQRRKNGYDGAWSVSALQRILDEETPRLGLWLDSTRLTPAETAEAILARADESLLDLPPG